MKAILAKHTFLILQDHASRKHVGVPRCLTQGDEENNGICTYVTGKLKELYNEKIPKFHSSTLLTNGGRCGACRIHGMNMQNAQNSCRSTVWMTHA
jgi:hypothetical protein